MNTVKVNAFAKVNLYLDIVGAKGEYHQLDTLVTSITLFDAITISKRSDNCVNLLMRGACAKDVPLGEDNNAVKAARAFIIKNNLGVGVDIIIDKKIPVGGGLGGSSADIAGTLIGMQALFKTDCDIKQIADSLGSDSGYMLTGGWARLNGRGDIVTELSEIDKKLDLIILMPKGGCSTKDVFALYDSEPSSIKENGVNRLIDQLLSGDIANCVLYNALQAPAERLNGGIKAAFTALKATGAKKVFLSGSGSAVCGVFDSETALDAAYDSLKSQGQNAYKAQTLTAKEVAKKLFD